MQQMQIEQKPKVVKYVVVILALIVVGFVLIGINFAAYKTTDYVVLGIVALGVLITVYKMVQARKQATPQMQMQMGMPQQTIQSGGVSNMGLFKKKQPMGMAPQMPMGMAPQQMPQQMPMAQQPMAQPMQEAPAIPVPRTKRDIFSLSGREKFKFGTEKNLDDSGREVISAIMAKIKETSGDMTPKVSLDMNERQKQYDDINALQKYIENYVGQLHVQYQKLDKIKEVIERDIMYIQAREEETM